MRGSKDSSRETGRVVAAIAAALLTAGWGLTGLGTARAGGLFLYEVGTPEASTAGAGWAARAQDAATVLTNPAGMARIESGDILLGAGALYGDIQFTPNANTDVSGGDGGVVVGWLPNGGAYYAHALSERWSFGVAAAGNFGLSESFDEGWVGRYYVEKSTLLGISFLPSLAYRVSPKLSLGASLNAMYGIFEDDVAINNLLPADPDGRLSMSATDLGFGGNVGVLWEPSGTLRLGSTYTSEVSLDFTDRPEFTDIGTGMQLALGGAGLLDRDLSIGIKVPQTLMTSFYGDFGDQWSLMGNVGWQDWSRFGGINVMVANDTPTSLTFQLPYVDTWHGSLGAKRRLGGGWLLSAGVGYDSSPIEDADRSVALPMGEAWRYAAGAQRRFGDKFDLGLGYTYLSMGTMTVDNERGPLAGRVAGAYENSVIHVVGLQAHWTF